MEVNTKNFRIKQEKNKLWVVFADAHLANPNIIRAEVSRQARVYSAITYTKCIDYLYKIYDSLEYAIEIAKLDVDIKAEINGAS